MTKRLAWDAPGARGAGWVGGHETLADPEVSLASFHLSFSARIWPHGTEVSRSHSGAGVLLP